MSIVLAGCSRDSSTRTDDSGIEGLVLAGPTCPVESADSPCPERPVATEITAVRASSDAFVKRGKSGVDGAFRISLPPGRYIVSAQGSGTGGSQPVTVVVEEGKYSHVEVHLDTGIR